jgi:hypothetical protein
MNRTKRLLKYVKKRLKGEMAWLDYANGQERISQHTVTLQFGKRQGVNFVRVVKSRKFKTGPCS